MSRAENTSDKLSTIISSLLNHTNPPNDIIATSSSEFLLRRQKIKSGMQIALLIDVNAIVVKFEEINALFDAVHQLSGTHYRKLFSVVTLLQFLSLG